MLSKRVLLATDTANAKSSLDIITDPYAQSHLASTLRCSHPVTPYYRELTRDSKGDSCVADGLVPEYIKDEVGRSRKNGPSHDIVELRAYSGRHAK